MREERPDRHRLFLWLGVALTVALAVYLRAAHPPEIVDDAYITFRYAKHLAAGEGFVYNSGERVLGTSSPFYTLLLAPGAMLFGPEGLPRWATSLNALFDGAAVLLLFAIAQHLGARPLAGIGVALLYALSDESAIFAIGGMETSLYVALLLGAGYLVLRRRMAAAGLVAALAALTRPDGLLLALLLGLAWSLHRSRAAGARSLPRPANRVLRLEKQEIYAILLFALPLLAWELFSLLYFGTLVPEALSAKRLAYSSDARWWQLAYAFLRHTPWPVFGNLGLGKDLGWEAIALHVILFGAGAAWMIRRDALAWTLGAFPLVYALAFSAGSPFLFQWYITPVIPFWLLGVVLGISALLDGAVSRLGRRWAQPRRAWVYACCFVALLFIAALEQHSHFKWRSDHFHPLGLQTHRERIYRRVALRLRQVIPPDSRVALAEIGAFGFYHPARVVDAVGLVTPDAQRCYPLPKSRYLWNSAIPAGLIEEQQPDYVVAFRDFMRLSLLPSPSFRAAYRWLGTFPDTLWESPGPWVYRRVSGAAIEAELAQARSALAQGDFEEGFRRLEAPLAYSRESRAEALTLLDEALYHRLSALSVWEHRFASGAFCDFERDADSGAWHLLDRWGRIYVHRDGRLVFFSAVSEMSLDAVAVDLEPSPQGWIVLDSLGALHPAGRELLPDWIIQPQGQEVADAIALEMIPKGSGLYILDAYGGIHWRGRSPDRLGVTAARRWGFPAARDLVLSPDGLHLYLVDSYGGVHCFGPDAGRIEAAEPPYWGWDAVRDAEFVPGANALVLATGLGSIHPYGRMGQEFSSKLPYPGWDYLTDIELDPETGSVIGLDSNGRIYHGQGSEE